MADFRVLIVDDHHEVRLMLRAGIESLGPRFEVVAVPSGEEALLEASRRPIHLLVSDVRLPGMTGLELMAKIKVRHPAMKVILITGLTDPKIRQQVASAGANAFFIKPLVLADFLDAVERTLKVVETFLPEAPIAAEPPAPPFSISQHLADLRQELKALAVALLDEEGKIMAQAGDVPVSGFDSSVLSQLMSAFHAGNKIALSMGIKGTESLFYLRGHQYDLTLAHVGSSHSLLVISSPLAKQKFPAKMTDLVFNAAGVFLDGMTKSGVLAPPSAGQAISQPLESTVEAPIEVSLPPEELVSLADIPEEEMSSMENLLRTAGEKKADDKELDTFWDNVLDQSDKSGSQNAKALSYEEAQRLGLAPKEGDR